jgi:hypothetical protein
VSGEEAGIGFKTLTTLHTVHLSDFCVSQNKERLFHYTALSGWLAFVVRTVGVYCELRTELCMKLVLRRVNYQTTVDYLEQPENR